MSAKTAAWNDPPAGKNFLAGGGEMGALTRALDWSKTPVGPLESWPQSLRTTISILLSSRYPMFLFWGPDAVCFYNDGYRPSLGAHKHPQALGQLGRDCWVDIWQIIGPQIESVMTRGDVTWHEDQLVPFDRNGYLEEIYFTYSYSPVRDESGAVGGTLVVCSETTDRVIGERRLRTLRDLAASASTDRGSREEIVAVCQILASNDADIPFALLYEVDEKQQVARLLFSAGVQPGTPYALAEANIEGGSVDCCPWPLRETLVQCTTQILEGLEAWPERLPGGQWPERAKQALVLPLILPGRSKPNLLLVAGVSPRKTLDAQYRTFYELAGAQIVSVVAHARALEEERKRAEALAELDRAKTEFFTNVSHEFRTPLTLMLNPLEDMIASESSLPEAYRPRLEMVHRNALRVLKLVNTLLDFSRIEAGRVDASYEPTDLAAFTAELASVFRSAIESAGLELRVACPPLPQPVYVDRDMWEKIVLNLLSNAFKFTFHGTIAIDLRPQENGVRLAVSDTGTGICEAELRRLFERFHRPQGARGRTHEGTGIGLALVQQLVKLHGGDIQVGSKPGEGTTFSVLIPFGTGHLPADQIGGPRMREPMSLSRDAYLYESRTGSSNDFEGSGDAGVTEERERILFVDDNADVRSYVTRLLAKHYDVTAAENGRAALETALEDPPDIVLSDIMMPELDGFALLRELRSNASTQAIPVILLSARAGEEASVEGMQAGADDYLAKPFTARELLSRIDAHLRLQRERRRAEERVMEIFRQAPVAICVLKGPDFIYELANPLYCELIRNREILGRRLIEVVPELSSHLLAIVQGVYRTGEAFVASELHIPLDRDRDGLAEDYWFNVTSQALLESDRRISAVIVAANEVTAQVIARTEIEKMNRELEEFAYVASHDLQEPLRAVNIYTELLLKRHVRTENEEARRYAEWVSGGVQRMQQLIRDLLAYSRSIHERSPFVPLADVSYCISAAVAVMKTRIQETGAVIDGDVKVVVRADPAQLTQVFQNLLSNALKYSKSSEAPRVNLAARRDGRNWIITVKDNGIGFDPRYADKVFGLFKRLHGRAYPGTGLGLAICKRIVERFGGSIWAEASPGQGAAFHISLRAAE